MKIFWEIAILSYILSELVYFEGGLSISLLVYPPHPPPKKKQNQRRTLHVSMDFSHSNVSVWSLI